MKLLMHIVCVVALATVFSIHVLQIVTNATTQIVNQPLTQQQWEKRAAATADDPHKARKVVLDAIYVNQTALVAAAYEKLYNAKPCDVRLGTFGYAAVVSERFRSDNDEAFKPAFHRAVGLLQHACAPEEEGTPAGANQSQLKRTQEANAWLAWGDVRLRSGFDVRGAEKAYRKALTFEPEMAEAYWWLADLTSEPYDDAYFKAHVAQARDYLDRADKLEPSLHPFIEWDRAYLYFGSGPTRANVAHGLPLQQEFLRLWPKNPHADAIRRSITRAEKALADKNFR